MSMKQTALALACVGGCALAVVSPSFAASATAFQFGVSPAVVAQAAMVGSEDRPSESVEVEYEYKTPVQGFGLSVPAGSVEVIRGVSGVQSAYYVHANRLW